MNHGIHSIASGGVAAQQRIDAIAQNLANASTPGFKAHVLLQHAGGAPAAAPSAAPVATPITRSRGQVDFGQGPIQRTGNPLDLSLTGDGFFVVAGPEGERLTRRGSFSLAPDGRVVTSGGLALQGDSGDIAIPTEGSGSGPIEIGTDGTVWAGSSAAGKIRVVTVGDPQALVREGESLFRSRAETPAAAGSFEIDQGAIEGSNVSVIEELVALIETVRGFEAYMTASSRLDDVTARAVNDLARA